MRDRVTAPRLIPSEPPPDAAKSPVLCRALGTHDWDVAPPLLIMPGGTVRVTLQCERCGSVRADRWLHRTGAVDSRQYRYSQAYTGLLEDTRDHARVGVMKSGKPQPLSAYVRATEKGARDGTHGAGLRLVSSRKKPRRRAG